ncbi:MAG: 3-hydroxyacyl-CoA dehydrogenase NAD-binding domain-containing protein, partial [Gammaproteobacteria bacterium]|nr:3-hydroxyacyl-CoA dehydrogenase NAD-binding domain-containing protein [Gammaproteobacteria bacterium]
MNRAIDITSLKHIRLERDSNNIAWLTFDQKHSRANVLGAEMFNELDTALDNISQEPPAGVVFQSAKPSGFIVGADVKAFTRVDTEIQAKEIVQTGQSMFNRIEALPVPTVALIHGFCLGGGLELALACDYRITCDDEPARIGLPEVLLGIHPGFGGTVRLIRLIGVIPAMTLMLQGRTVDGRKAGRLGIVDEVIPRRHFRLAAEKRIRTKPGTSRAAAHWRLLELGLFRPLVALLLRRQVASKVNADHYPAPFALIDLWRHHGGNARAMMDGEADSIGQLFIQPTTKRLVRVFLLQERLKGLGNAESGFECRHVHVIGAGVMGGDIAAWCAYKGLRVTLQDREPGFIGPAMQRANKLFKQRIRDKYERQAASDRLIPDHRGHGVRHADVVIEAIIENLDAKTSLFQDILPRMKSTAVLATNTSSIPLEKLASRLGEPSRLIGLHFFNPVSRMQLVEVINAKQTAPEQVQHGMVFTRAIDRLPLPVKSSPGFLVNRVLLPYLVEAVILLE